jgi:hypothetical protein
MSSLPRALLKEKTTSGGKNRASAPTHKSKKKSAPPPPDYEVDTPSEHSDVENDILSEMSVSDNDDNSRPIPTAKKGKGTARNKKREQTVASAESSSVPAYMMMLAGLASVGLYEIQENDVSTFIPNCWMMYQVLGTMHDLVGDNASLSRYCPFYMTALSNIYYGIIFIVQVLRAKQAAHTLEQSDFQFLRFFESNFAIEELPVAGPLVLFFQNLAAYKPDSNRFTWVVPTLPSLAPANGTHDPIGTTPTRLSIPPIPWMIDILRQFGNANAALLTAMDTAGQFEPFDFATGGTIAGFATGAAFASSAHAAALLQAPGLHSPWAHSTDTLRKKVNQIKRLGLPALAGPKKAPRDFCGLGTHITWFTKIISAVAHEAKYFAGSTVLANINPTSGPSTVLIARADNPAAAIIAPTSWYPGSPFSHSSTYVTMGSTVSPDDQKIGIFTSTCKTFAGANFGEFRNSHAVTGPFFTAATNQSFSESGHSINPATLVSPTIMINMYRPKGGESNSDE